jgi:molybdopterin adenylyltransferase
VLPASRRQTKQDETNWKFSQFCRRDAGSTLFSPMKIGRLTISDRASAGIYADKSGPEIENALREIFGGGMNFISRVVPDEVEKISAALKEFADAEKCDLIVTTGGTGISSRDVTPEATVAILEKQLPGFGEAMRMQSLAKVKTAILSRAVAGTRGKSLIVNLPGKPTAVRECLEILAPAIREGVAHLRGEDPHGK